MNKLALMLTTVVVAITGCGGGNDNAGSAGTTQPPASSGQVPFDRAFIDAMVPHHQSAIKMAREARRAGLTEPDLIEVVDDIIGGQQEEIERMLGWRAEWFGSRQLEPQADALAVLGLSADEAGMKHSMDLGMAADVDQEFAQSMIAHHEGAIRMARVAVERADHAEVRRSPSTSRLRSRVRSRSWKCTQRAAIDVGSGERSEMSEVETYVVPGVHCAHCEAAITEQVSGVRGVISVAVDLESKLVTITGEALDDGALRQAIGEAGYEVAA